MRDTRGHRGPPDRENVMRLQDKLAGWIDDRPLARWLELYLPRWAQGLLIALLAGLAGGFIAFFLTRLLGGPGVPGTRVVG